MSDAPTQLEQIQRLKEILVLYATGDRSDNNDEYKNVRRQVLHDVYLKSRVPQFVQDCVDLGEFWAFIKPLFSTYRERREFLRQEFLPLVLQLEAREANPTDQIVSETLSTVDWAHVQDAWRKALGRRFDDPEGAITAARTLLETVCKHILEAEGVEYSEKSDLPQLYDATAKSLNVAPTQAAERVVRQILGGCSTVVNGIAALRNKTGDAHGKSRGEPVADLIQAELAVSVAGAIASFLIKTFATSDPFA